MNFYSPVFNIHYRCHSIGHTIRIGSKNQYPGRQSREMEKSLEGCDFEEVHVCTCTCACRPGPFQCDTAGSMLDLTYHPGLFSFFV